MKLFATLTIWVLAVLLAGLLILKLLRGRPVLVRSAVGRRAIRIAALVLVFTGTSGLVGGKAAGQGAEQAPRAEGDKPAAEPQPIPATMTELLDALLTVYTEASLGGTTGRHIAQLLAYHDGAITLDQLSADEKRITALQSSAPHLYRVIQTQTPRLDLPVPDDAEPIDMDWATLRRATQEANAPSLLHPGVQALLWRQSQSMKVDGEEDAKHLSWVLSELKAQTRVYHTLTRALAQARVAPMRQDQHAWASKAGPRPDRTIRIIEAQMPTIRQAVIELYPVTTAGLWDDEGVFLLASNDPHRPVIMSVVEHRDTVLFPQLETRFGRLDLLYTLEKGGRISTPWLGEIELPANATLRASDLPPLLSDASRAKIAETILAVLDRPEVQFDDDVVAPAETAAQAAAVQLERHLPLVAPMLAEAIREHPEAYGSATLRTLLNQYQLPVDVVDPVRRGAGLEREGFTPGREGF